MLMCSTMYGPVTVCLIKCRQKSLTRPLRYSITLELVSGVETQFRTWLLIGQLALLSVTADDVTRRRHFAATVMTHHLHSPDIRHTTYNIQHTTYNIKHQIPL